MEHYFSSTPQSRSQEKQIKAKLRGHAFAFYTNSGVFAKKEVDFGSRLLIEQVEGESGSRLLDLGCGYGPIGIALAVSCPQLQVVMVDINERAVRLAELNSKQNRVEERVEVRVSDGFTAIKAEERFDIIVSNPPIRAGKKVIYPWFAQAKQHLQPQGSLWLVVRKQQGAASVIKELQQHYAQVDTGVCKKGYCIIRARVR
jgi:16S rRNA (guanine1207-N2)-methyltransferase